MSSYYPVPFYGLFPGIINGNRKMLDSKVKMSS